MYFDNILIFNYNISVIYDHKSKFVVNFGLVKKLSRSSTSNVNISGNFLIRNPRDHTRI